MVLFLIFCMLVVKVEMYRKSDEIIVDNFCLSSDILKVALVIKFF